MGPWRLDTTFSDIYEIIRDPNHCAIVRDSNPGYWILKLISALSA